MRYANVDALCDVVILAHFATADLAAGAFEMPGKVISDIYKIQENAWQPGLYPGPPCGELKALPGPPVAGGDGAAWLFPLPKTIPQACLGLGLRSFGSHLSRPKFSDPEI